MAFLELVWLKVVVMQRNAIEYLKVVWRYYANSNFRSWDLALLAKYFLRNPYRICHSYLKKIGLADPYLYGETPLTSLEVIAAQCDIKKSDIFFELGCGRGRGCFWLKSFIGCKIIGIEIVPDFVEKALRVKERYQIRDLDFIQGDIATANYQGATILYLYGTCFEDLFIKELIEKFKSLPKGTKLITVSYALTEYTQDPIFEVIKVFPVKFTWGEADVYLQVRT